MVRYGLIFSSIVQIIGASLLADRHKPEVIGRGIVILGLILSMIFYVLCFLFCFHIYVYVINEYNRLSQQHHHQQFRHQEYHHLLVSADGINISRKWLYIFFGLFVSILLLNVRALYRVIHYIQRYQQEWSFYIFDTLLIAIITFTWTIFHPGRYDPENIVIQ